MAYLVDELGESFNWAKHIAVQEWWHFMPLFGFGWCNINIPLVSSEDTFFLILVFDNELMFKMQTERLYTLPAVKKHFLPIYNICSNGEKVIPAPY